MGNSTTRDQAILLAEFALLEGINTAFDVHGAVNISRYEPTADTPFNFALWKKDSPTMLLRVTVTVCLPELEMLADRLPPKTTWPCTMELGGQLEGIVAKRLEDRIRSTFEKVSFIDAGPDSGIPNA